MSDEYADGRYRYGTDALVADNRIGPNFGKPMIHRSCSQQISTLQSQLAAALARAEAAELDKRATYAVLSRYVYAVQQTRWPKMDNSHWEAVIELAHAQHISLIAEASAALAAAAPGEGERSIRDHVFADAPIGVDPFMCMSCGQDRDKHQDVIRWCSWRGWCSKCGSRANTGLLPSGNPYCKGCWRRIRPHDSDLHDVDSAERGEA